MHWYKLVLGDGQAAHGIRLHIKEAFWKHIFLNGQSDDRAIFTNVPTREDRRFILFIPPVLADFARTLPGVQECDQPKKDGLLLVVACNPTEVWKLCFPAP